MNDKEKANNPEPRLSDSGRAELGGSTAQSEQGTVTGGWGSSPKKREHLPFFVSGPGLDADLGHPDSERARSYR